MQDVLELLWNNHLLDTATAKWFMQHRSMALKPAAIRQHMACTAHHIGTQCFNYRTQTVAPAQPCTPCPVFPPASGKCSHSQTVGGVHTVQAAQQRAELHDAKISLAQAAARRLEGLGDGVLRRQQQPVRAARVCPVLRDGRNASEGPQPASTQAAAPCVYGRRKGWRQAASNRQQHLACMARERDGGRPQATGRESVGRGMPWCCRGRRIIRST